ncbi:putative transcription factor B3-Domain family [Helianthus annuus]|nr:putative transcription factor B3-Domain family [Helianthus annuus]
MYIHTHLLHTLPVYVYFFHVIFIDKMVKLLQSLPPEYVTMHLVNKIRNNPIIRSANGGYSWRLKIKQIGDDYCFVNGWNNVVKDIQLGFGDFLLFKLVDQSTFRMSIYSPDGCEKILQPKTDQNGCEKILTTKILHDDDDDDDPSFVSTFTKSHLKRLVRFITMYLIFLGFITIYFIFYIS